MLVVIQGTSFCNLNCSYCYLPGRDVKSRLRVETVERLAASIARMAGPPRQIDVVWHAGEPMLLPPGFYQEAFAAFDRASTPDAEVSHGFQTNGTLIDDRWIEFLLRHQPSVGISIDGPQFIHDANRRYRSGAGSWEACMKGIRLLQSARVPFHTISVLTALALREPVRMFRFFLDAGLLDVAFNIEEIEGVHRESTLSARDCEAHYSRFLRSVLRQNAGAGYPLRIRESERVAQSILDNGIPCNSQVEAGQILCMDVAGNVSTFSPELLGLRNAGFSDFIIGNVWERDIDEMLAGPVARALAREVAIGVANCRRGCEFFRFCRGGAPANKWAESGSFRATETLFCRLTVKQTVRACVDELFELMADASGWPEQVRQRNVAVALTPLRPSDRRGSCCRSAARS